MTRWPSEEQNKSVWNISCCWSSAEVSPRSTTDRKSEEDSNLGSLGKRSFPFHLTADHHMLYLLKKISISICTNLKYFRCSLSKKATHLYFHVWLVRLVLWSRDSCSSRLWPSSPTWRCQKTERSTVHSVSSTHTSCREKQQQHEFPIWTVYWCDDCAAVVACWKQSASQHPASRGHYMQDKATYLNLKRHVKRTTAWKQECRGQRSLSAWICTQM